MELVVFCIMPNRAKFTCIETSGVDNCLLEVYRTNSCRFRGLRIFRLLRADHSSEIFSALQIVYYDVCFLNCEFLTVSLFNHEFFTVLDIEHVIHFTFHVLYYIFEITSIEKKKTNENGLTFC